MRRPFFVKSVKVTEDNIDLVAEWCDGAVVDDGERLFIRVPVEGARNVRQTEAHVDYWVVRSKSRGIVTFKVYRQPWLERDFIEVEDYGDDDEPVRPLVGDKTRIIETKRASLPGARVVKPATASPFAV
jgi:hypothetical protein